jgi:hypothetical protein
MADETQADADQETPFSALASTSQSAFTTIMDSMFGKGAASAYAEQVAADTEAARERAEAARSQAETDAAAARERRVFKARHDAWQTIATTWLIVVLGVLAAIILAGAAVGIWRVAL